MTMMIHAWIGSKNDQKKEKKRNRKKKQMPY